MHILFGGILFVDATSGSSCTFVFRSSLSPQSNGWLLFTLLISDLNDLTSKQTATMPARNTPWKNPQTFCFSPGHCYTYNKHKTNKIFKFTLTDILHLLLLLHLCCWTQHKCKLKSTKKYIKKKKLSLIPPSLLLSLCSGICFLTVLRSAWNGQSQVTSIYRRNCSGFSVFHFKQD